MIQTIPIKEYWLQCETDGDLELYQLPPDFEKAKAALLAYREDYPHDKFKLVALIDA